MKTDLIAVGRFGADLGELLLSLAPHDSFFLTADLSHVTPGSSSRLLMFSQLTAAVHETLSRSDSDQGAALTPIQVTPTSILIGPTLLRGVSLCWQCWLSRKAQLAESLFVHDATENLEGEAPLEGYLPAHLALVASVVLRTCGTVIDIQANASRIYEVNLFTLAIETRKMAGLDGCPRCGLHRELRSRSYAAVEEALQHLWTQPVTLK